MLRLPYHVENFRLRIWLLAWKSVKNYRFRLRSRKCLTFTLISLFSLIILVARMYQKYHISEADVKVVYVNTLSSIAEAELLDGATVSIAGWKYYAKLNQNVPMSASFNLKQEKNSAGYWMLRSRRGVIPSHQMQIKDFQLTEEHDVAVAIRYFVRGDVNIRVKFTDGEGDSSTVVLHRQVEQSNVTEFCTQIVRQPEELNRVEQLEISAESTGQFAFVVIDKVLVAVGNDRRSLHLIYTLLPTGWCPNASQAVVTRDRPNKARIRLQPSHYY